MTDVTVKCETFTMPPPSLPRALTYTSCWCEENVYLLCSHFLGDHNAMHAWNIYTVFISNHSKTVSGTHCIVRQLIRVKVALWMQKKAPPSSPIVWDYHVVLLFTSRSGDQSLIYDFDTTLPFPCPAQGCVPPA